MQVYDGEIYGMKLGTNQPLVSNNMKRVDGKWKCELPGCNFTRSNKNAVKRHVHRHLGLRPYMCLHCPLRTNQKAPLLTHYITKHLGKTN